MRSLGIELNRVNAVIRILLVASGGAVPARFRLGKADRNPPTPVLHLVPYQSGLVAHMPVVAGKAGPSMVLLVDVQVVEVEGPVAKIGVYFRIAFPGNCLIVT